MCIISGHITYSKVGNDKKELIFLRDETKKERRPAQILAENTGLNALTVLAFAAGERSRHELEKATSKKITRRKPALKVYLKNVRKKRSKRDSGYCEVDAYIYRERVLKLYLLSYSPKRCGSSSKCCIAA